MTTPSPPTRSTRYLAADLHKHYLVIGGLDAQLKSVLAPKRLSLEAWPAWAKAHLRPSDHLVVESTSNAFDFYDQVAPLVGRVVVANPAKIALIASTRVKTDKADTLWLARLLVAGLIPEVWVPPAPVRELRSLLAHRQRLVQSRTRLRNRLHSVLHRHGLAAPEGDPFGPAQRSFWAQLAVSPTEQLRVRHDLAGLDHLATQLDELQAELERLSTVTPWAEPLPYLLQLPGFGLIVALTLLAGIGEITRFPSAKELVGYAGLGSRVHDSGQTHRTGKLTKTGRRELRWALVEASWRAVDHHPTWKDRFERLKARMSANQAIIAIAHQLLIVLWHVLSKHEADRQAEPEKVALKFLCWAGQLTPEQRGGLTTGQFARLHLHQLQLGEDLTQVGRGSHQRRLPPVAAVMTRSAAPVNAT
jgi:transposase